MSRGTTTWSFTLRKPKPKLFGALGDGNVTLAIAERTTRRGRYAEVHGSASHFCRNSAEDRAGGLTCVQTDRAT
jgi:hypothetical protein